MLITFLSVANGITSVVVLVLVPSFDDLLSSMETTQFRIRFIKQYFLALTY